MNEPTPGLPIICADNVSHGNVEGTEREYLVTMPLEDGQRHYIPLDVVDRVDDAVYLRVTQEELLQLL